MANPKLLLVDADPRSVRILGVSLRSSGYRVTSSSDAIDAMAKAESIAPDLVLCDTRLPKTDGYALVRALRARPESARIPVILLSAKDSAEERKRGAELGVEDFLTKPVIVGELLARIQLVLARRLRESIAAAPHGRARFSGSTQELPMVDLLQTFDETGRSGVVHLRSGVQEAELYFRDGRLVDAELGRLRGEEAVYRVLMWHEASFDIELKTITLENVIGGTTEEITMEGMRRLDAWGLLRERLQPVASLFEVDHAQVLEQLNGVVRLLDVNKSPSDATRDEPFELSALSGITRGLLVPGPDASSPAEGREGRRIVAQASESAPVAAARPSPAHVPVQAIHASALEREEQEEQEEQEEEDEEQEHRTSGHAPSAPFFGDVVPESQGAPGGVSLLPTTREVRAGAEPPPDDDMAAAG
ncbi:MAG: response regulator, partial [Myxococcota bacterium]|nr:response regulator [Myxococcota bacterium]